MQFVCSVERPWWRLCKASDGGGQAPDIGLRARKFNLIIYNNLKLINAQKQNQKKPFPYVLCMGG